MAPLWHQLLESMSRIQRIVHLAARKVDDDADRIRVDLLRIMRRAYEDELTIQAGRAGCPGRRGRLSNGPILSGLNDQAREWAEGIVDTYNRDLAAAIIRIRHEAPRANRHVYAARLRTWDEQRAKWKNVRISQHAEMEARSRAQQDFYRNNGHGGYAVLRPKEAVCPVCMGLVKRGKVPIAVAEAHPPPYHPSCVVPGQSILLADGNTCPIEEVQAGDNIQSSLGPTRVGKVFRRWTQETVYCVSVGDQVLRLTGDHPVKTTRGWIPTRDLVIGDEILAVSHAPDVGGISCIV